MEKEREKERVRERKTYPLAGLLLYCLHPLRLDQAKARNQEVLLGLLSLELSFHPQCLVSGKHLDQRGIVENLSSTYLAC